MPRRFTKATVRGFAPRIASRMRIAGVDAPAERVDVEDQRVAVAETAGDALDEWREPEIDVALDRHDDHAAFVKSR